MRRVLLTALVLVAGLAVVAQAGTLDKVYTVTLVANQFKVDGLNGVTRTGILTDSQCENITFLNNSGVYVCATNTEAPFGQRMKPQRCASNGNTTSNMTFCCPTDKGTWVITVDDLNNTATAPAVVTLIVNCADVPATGTFGIIVLGLLLAGTAVFLLRRRATV